MYVFFTPKFPVRITQVMYLVHLILMCVVRFAMISNTIHHHRVAVMNQVDRMSLLVYAQFCTVFVENGEFLVSHGQAYG